MDNLLKELKQYQDIIKALSSVFQIKPDGFYKLTKPTDCHKNDNEAWRLFYFYKNATFYIIYSLLVPQWEKSCAAVVIWVEGHFSHGAIHFLRIA